MIAFAQTIVSSCQDPKGINRSCPDGACHYHEPGPVQILWDSCLDDKYSAYVEVTLGFWLVLPHGANPFLLLPDTLGMYF